MRCKVCNGFLYSYDMGKKHWTWRFYKNKLKCLNCGRFYERERQKQSDKITGSGRKSR